MKTIVLVLLSLYSLQVAFGYRTGNNQYNFEGPIGYFLERNYTNKRSSF